MTPNTTEPHTLYQWREQLLETLLRGMLVIGLFALVGGGIIPAIQLQRPDLLITYLVAYGALVLVTFVPKLGFPLRAAVLLLLLYALGALDFSVAGLSGDGRVLLFAFVVVSTALLNLSRGIVALTKRLKLASSREIGVGAVSPSGRHGRGPDALDVRCPNVKESDFFGTHIPFMRTGGK